MTIRHAALGILLASAISASSQEEPYRFSMGERYARTYQVDLPFEIHFSVPRVHNVRVQYPPDAGGSLIRINLVSDDGEFIESFQLTTLTLPVLADQEVRTTALAELIVVEGMQRTFGGRAAAAIRQIRNRFTPTMIAISVSGTMKADDGRMLLVSLTGMAERTATRGLLAVGFIDPGLSPARDITLIDDAYYRMILDSLRYSTRPAEDGESAWTNSSKTTGRPSWTHTPVTTASSATA